MKRNLFVLTALLLVLAWVTSACNTIKPDLAIQTLELKTVEVDGKQVSTLKSLPGQNTYSQVVKFKVRNRPYKVGMVYQGADIDQNFMLSGYIRNPNLYKDIGDPKNPDPAAVAFNKNILLAKLYFAPNHQTYLQLKNKQVVKTGSGDPGELLIDVTTPADPNNPPTVLTKGDSISFEKTVFFTCLWSSKEMIDPKTGKVVNPKPLELVLFVDSTDVIDEYLERNNKKAVEIYIP